MQKKQETTGLVWFGNDLRTHDNEVLFTAIEKHKKVIAVYCIDPKLFQNNSFNFKKTEVFRSQFLLETLKNLQNQLLKINISLLFYRIHRCLEFCFLVCLYKLED